MKVLTKALEDFQKSLGATIEVTVSPDNPTTNKIMKSAFLIAKDKVRAYAKNNNVMKNDDLASLTRMQREMTLKIIIIIIIMEKKKSPMKTTMKTTMESPMEKMELPLILEALILPGILEGQLA